MTKLSIGNLPDRKFHNPLGGDATRFTTINLAITPIEILREDGLDLGFHATEFFWLADNASYLITNWHNVSGKNPFTMSSINSNGFVPGRFRCFPPIRQGGQFLLTTRYELEAALYEHFAEPCWLEHPEFDALKIDVVAIKLSARLEDGSHLNDYPDVLEDKLMHLVGHDVFILGYPFKNYTGSMIPIWKRGSIASEPLIPIDGKPMFIVDAASRKGMSGSPVFRMVFGPALHRTGDIQVDNARKMEFAGVYSGHLDTDLADITIGLCWYRNVIEELIQNGIQGKRH